MSRIFINRERELEFLNQRYKSGRKEIIIIYGRRRVGKTELIKEFIKDKDAIYFLADRRGTMLNAHRFMELVSEHFECPYLEPRNFDDVFKLITKFVNEKKKRFVVVIDEFSYLLEQDDTIASVFQYIIDEILTDRIMLILCGSTIGLMESLFSYKNPMYGRRTGQWKVEPMSFFEFSQKFKTWSTEERIRMFAVTGGIPFYFMQMDENKSVFENIEAKILNKSSILYEEVEFLLREGLRNPAAYLSILEAIARGNTRITDISNYTKIRTNDLPKYLNTLMKLGVVEREIPVTEHWKKTKKSLYFIKNDFFRFWFRFVFPNKSKIEAGLIDDVMKTRIIPQFNQFVGQTFEKIAKVFIMHNLKLFAVERIGRYWDKQASKGKRNRSIEIDIVAINSYRNTIAFFEVKWASLSYKKAMSILRDLKEKSKAVKWHLDNRTEFFGIIAKRIENKEKLREENFIAYDLEDF